MKFLSKLLGFLAISALLMGNVYANNNDLVAKKDAFMESLNLTADQKTKIDAIVANSNTERNKILQKYQGQQKPEAMKDMRSDIESLHNNTQKQLAEVLTEEQLIKLQTFEDQILADIKAKSQQMNSSQ